VRSRERPLGRLLVWTPEPDRNVVLGSFPGRSRRNQDFLASVSQADLADGVGPLGLAYPVRKTCWVRLGRADCYSSPVTPPHGFYVTMFVLGWITV